MRSAVIKFLAVLACFAATASAHAGRIEDIRARGYFGCGIGPHVEGFAVKQGDGYVGFDADTCRAVAAAILGPDAKVVFTPAENVRQLKEDAAIDLVARRITWSLSRAATHDLMFGPITFYDGQGFMIPRGQTLDAVSRICVEAGPHTKTLADHLRATGKAATIVAVENDAAAEQALDENRCGAYSADVTWLAAARGRFKDGVARFDILPQMVSKEPLAPLVRRGDDRFFEVVRWAIFAVIEAEERGITSHDAARFKVGHGAVLGLDELWAQWVIAAVGNYAEMYDRNLGVNSPLKLERGINRLWTNGGLIYAPPLR
jgi:general L-amino acid transport system substrate-binding protein